MHRPIRIADEEEINNREWKNYAYEILREDPLDEPIPDPGYLSSVHLALKINILKAALYLKSLWKQDRLTHTSGIGAFGMAEVCNNDKVPENEYFKPGQVLSVYLRHGNLMPLPDGLYPDDRCLDVRSASIKLDMEGGSPVDFVMNTGDRCPFWNGPTMEDFMASLGRPQKVQGWLKKNSLYYYNTVQGLRKAPTSYADLHYYAQMTYELTDSNGVLHYVRFRLVPDHGDDSECRESGLPSHEDQRKYFEDNEGIRHFDDDDARVRSLPIDYLRKEYENRLLQCDDDASNEPSILYRLQIQVAEPTRHASERERLELFHMGRPWADNPWLDLARITIYRSLHPVRTNRLQFNVGNLPPCLALPDAPSYGDYRSIGHIRKAIYGAVQRSRLARTGPGLKTVTREVEIKYKVTVKTMSSKRSGYGGRAFLSVLGDRGETGFLELCGTGIIGALMRFEDGGKHEFSFQARDVGVLWAVEFYLADPLDGWYIATVNVRKDGMTSLFPCYQWIYDHGIFRTAEAKLLKNDCGLLKALRKLEKQKWRNRLVWRVWESMPSYSDFDQHSDLPRDLQFLDEKMVFFYEKRDEGRLNTLYNKSRELVTAPFQKLLQLNPLKNLFHSDKNDYHKYSKFFHFRVGDNKVPDVARRWFTDRDYGRQFLQGSHPTAFHQVDGKVPEKFGVTDNDVRASLGRGVTLQDAIDAGHIYMVDCEQLEGIPAAEGRFITPAMGLFYVNAVGDFLPIAIQLKQTRGFHNPLWTPQDKQEDWVLAKMWLRCADSQIHQLRDHLLLTHLVMEPFVVSMYRNLPSVHPIYKLLLPHVRYTIAINTIGRLKLVGKDGLADLVLSIGKGGHMEYIKKCYKEFDFRQLSLTYTLKERKVDDPDKLPHYYYRDDAKRLWGAIEEYVKATLTTYYHTDDDVANDTEIRDWIQEIHDVGLPTHHQDDSADGADTNTHHVPSSVDSRDELVDLLVCVIFTCSVEHAAQNFGQYDYYAFYPNAPMTMRKPPPTEKGQATAEQIIDTLGNTENVSMQVFTVWLLATLGPEEIYLGQFPEDCVVEDGARLARDEFRRRLDEIEKEIKNRNEGLEVPYTYLLPSRVPRSIAV